MRLPAWVVEFETAKYAVVRDARLGLLWWVLTACCLGYTIFSILLLHKGWLGYESVSGTVQARLLPPGSSDELTYFSHRTESSRSALAPYCFELPCQALDEYQLTEGLPGTPGALFVATRVRERLQLAIGNQSEQPDAIRFQNAGTSGAAENHDSSFFALAPEVFRVRLDHSVFAPRAQHVVSGHHIDGSHHDTETGLSESSKHMTGKLQMNGGGSVALPKGSNDIFSLNQLLEAAGVHLDDSECDVEEHRGRRLRTCGVVLHVTIEYKNVAETWFGGIVEPTYEVRVFRLPETEFAARDVVSRTYQHSAEDRSAGSERILRVDHGVLLQFVQIGRLAWPSLSSFVVNFSSGVGLISVVTVLVDQLAIYILPLGKSYYTGTRDLVEHGQTEPKAPSASSRRRKKKKRT